MRGRWLGILVFLVMIVGVLPVAAQSSCTISTRATVRLRAGHSTTDAVVGNMPRNVQLQVVERFLEPIGKKTRIWYRLLKEEAAPTATAEQVWVGGTVKTKGDCVNIASAAPAAPVTDAGGAPAAPATDLSGITMPQNGTWGWTIGDTMTVSCPNLGSADVPYVVVMGGLPNQFDVSISNSANGFTVDGVEFTRGGDGTWYGYYTDANGTATIRVDSPTNILGDLIVNGSDGCTLKAALWGTPR